MRRRAIAALAATLALSAPGAALAQSAGDDQYRDPFAEENEGQQGGSNGGDTGGGSTPSPTPSPTPAPAPGPAPPAGTSAADPTATTADTLPRTGAGAGWMTAAGLVLIAAGAGLRRSLRA